MSFALKGYLTIYWTQFMGIDNYLMASLLLIVQIWDAINDPIIGAMVDADTHKYRRNKFLAYIWFGAIGLTVAGALCYLPFPQAPGMVKNILFVAGYMIWDAFYTVANVPYGSMLSLISDDPIQRAQLSTFRSIGSMGGALLTGMLIPVIIYDNQNNLRGEQMFVIALIMGLIGLVCFRFMVTNTKVRVDTTITLKEDAPKFNIVKAFNNFIHNRPAVGATLAPIATFIGMYGASTAGQILFQAYFKNAKISGLVGMISYFGVFIFSPFVSRIVKRFGKKEAVTFGSVVCALAYVLMLVLPITPDGRGLSLYVLCQVIAMLGGGIGSCLSWSLMADAIDYNEWKFGVREEGTTYALHSFFRKLAQGIGPSLGLVLATKLGYDASLKAAQTIEVATRMRYLVPVMYLGSYIVMIIAYGVVFNLDKKTLAQMESDLKERRAKNEK